MDPARSMNNQDIDSSMALDLAGNNPDPNELLRFCSIDKNQVVYQYNPEVCLILAVSNLVIHPRH